MQQYIMALSVMYYGKTYKLVIIGLNIAVIVLLVNYLFFVSKITALNEELPNLYLQLHSDTYLSKIYFVKKENNKPIYTAESIPRNRSIFFFETSGRKYLRLKELCALESAARVHTDRQVYFFMTSFDLDDQDIVKELKSRYSNIQIKSLDLTNVFTNTIFQKLWFKNDIQGSLYYNSHLSDVLRMWFLYKFGGTYLDSDLIVLKQLPTEFNFFGLEHSWDPTALASGVAHWSDHHPLIDMVIKDVAENFCPKCWGENGPKIADRAVRKFCNAQSLHDVNNKNCFDIHIFDPSAFYPIYFLDWKKYFDPKYKNEVMEKIKDSYIAHYWGKFSSSTAVNRFQPFFEIASRNCPLVAKKF